MDRIEQKAFELASAIVELRVDSGYHDYTSTMTSIYTPPEKLAKPISKLGKLSQQWLSRLAAMKKSKDLDVDKLKRYFYGTSVYVLATDIVNIMFKEDEDTTMVADFIKFIYNLDTDDKFNRFMTYFYRYYARVNTSNNYRNRRDSAKIRSEIVDIMFTGKSDRVALENIYKHCITRTDGDTLISSVSDSNMCKPKKANIPVIIKPDIIDFNVNKVKLSEIKEMVIGTVDYFLEEIITGKPTLRACGVELTGVYGKSKLESYRDRKNKKQYVLYPIFIDDDTLAHPYVSLEIFKELKTKVVFILEIV
mgnify:CR=1 FL=1|jgi:hypothetical protein